MTAAERSRWQTKHSLVYSTMSTTGAQVNSGLPLSELVNEPDLIASLSCAERHP
jgi:hypothetical protein